MFLLDASKEVGLEVKAKKIKYILKSFYQTARQFLNTIKVPLVKESLKIQRN
jgi:hypothetical protein